MDSNRDCWLGRVGWRWGNDLHFVALVSLLLLACTGRVPESSAGWLTCPPVSYATQAWAGRRVGRQLVRVSPAWAAARRFVDHTYPRLFRQTALLLLLAGPGSGSILPSLPLVCWLVDLSAALWPGWGSSAGRRVVSHGLFRFQQLALVLLGVSFIYPQFASQFASQFVSQFAWQFASQSASAFASPLASFPGSPFDSRGGGFGSMLPLALGAMAILPQESTLAPLAEGRILEDGTYELHLRGDFVIRYKACCEFARRMFLVFIRQIRLVGGPPKRVFVRQEQLATWYGDCQEEISRWETCHRAGAWVKLMGGRIGPLFSQEDRDRVLRFWAHNLTWTAEEVAQRLVAEGLLVTTNLVETIAHDSGFWWVRQELRQRLGDTPSGLQVRDEWLLRRLFELVNQLSAKLEAGEKVTTEERLEISGLQALQSNLGDGEPGEPRAVEKGLPPIHALEKLLLGSWQDVDDGSVHCPHCGSPRVGRKSRKGRPKRFLDAQGRELVIEVYRYYCCNKDCPWGSFTLLPPGLVPYSRWTQFHRWLTLQEYAVERGCYRWTARAVGISTATAYRWVSGFGRELLPVAAIFGVVRSSGVVSVDEKWVKVPKNNKPPGKFRDWMYVYLAVDVYTYDLLHIAIFPYDNTESAQAFLLELRAKGYHPAVIVTDLRQDYGSVIAAVFPKAEHHECVFHARQGWSRQLREAYGSHYREKVPEAAALHDDLGKIFHAKTKRTARDRYDEVMALREAYVKQTPAVACVFDSLEKHFPKLVNAIESDRIPLTNNAVEQVIRRFEQHYRGFCGFNTIETAETYLAVFELVYRFSPLTLDAQPRVRGKSPLELAGYDTAKFPIAQALRGIPLPKPISQPGSEEVVPSV